MSKRNSAGPRLGEGTRLLIGAAGFIGGRGGGRLVYLFTQVLLGRLLAPFQFGILVLGLSIFRLVESVGTLGLQVAVIRFGARDRARASGEARRTILKGLGLAVLSGLVLAVVVFAAAPLLANRLFDKPSLVGVLRIFALGFPLVTVLVVGAAATRNLRTSRYAVLTKELGQPALFLVFSVAALAVGLKARGAALAAVLSTGIAAVVALVILIRLFPKGDGRNAHVVPTATLLAFSLPAALST
ncbi:MAG TPA: oligosaccharide flippase family protein, partial [Thermoanaerobaculia bacterium]|nr:oligosaccharide flippase family protein [Thermoanaerobaculia bacterium]